MFVVLNFFEIFIYIKLFSLAIINNLRFIFINLRNRIILDYVKEVIDKNNDLIKNS